MIRCCDPHEDDDPNAASRIREALRAEDYERLPFLLTTETVLWQLDFSGSSCMHFACYFMLPSHFDDEYWWKWILEQAAHSRQNFLKVKNNRGQIVFDIFFQSWFRPSRLFQQRFPDINHLQLGMKNRRNVEKLQMYLRGEANEHILVGPSYNVLLRFWTSLDMIIKATVFGRVDVKDSLSMLPFLAALPYCPDRVMQLAVELFPEQLRQTPLPLHAWATSPAYQDLHSDVLKIIVKAYPEALTLQEELSGRTALHMAAATGRPLHEIEELWGFDPSMLDVPCPVTKLPPFALLAVDSDEKERQRVDRIIANFGISASAQRTLTVSAVFDVHTKRASLARLSSIYSALRASPNALPNHKAKPPHQCTAKVVEWPNFGKLFQFCHPKRSY